MAQLLMATNQARHHQPVLPRQHRIRHRLRSHDFPCQSPPVSNRVMRPSVRWPFAVAREFKSDYGVLGFTFRSQRSYHRRTLPLEGLRIPDLLPTRNPPRVIRPLFRPLGIIIP